jgi:hypothetical protein
MDAARAQLAHAGRLLGEGRTDEALLWIDRAVDSDPWMAEAWANRGIQAHRQGRHGDAALAYRVALSLKPTLEPARRGLDSLELPPEDEDPALLLGSDPSRAAAALALAGGLESRPLTAAVVLELCLHSGGEEPDLRARLAMAYAAAGWSEDALRTLEGATFAEAEALRAGLGGGAREQGRRAEALLEDLAGDLGILPEEARALSVEVARRLAGSVREEPAARARMRRWLRTRRGLSEELGGLRLPLGVRWYRASVTGGDSGSSPADVFRLWPGDTQLAAWLLPLPESGAEGLVANLPELIPELGVAPWTLTEERLGFLDRPVLGGWRPATLEGPGRLPARVWLVPHEEGVATLVVGLPGEGGAGEAGAGHASAELETVIAGLGEVSAAPTREPDGADRLRLPVPPDLRSPRQTADEATDPWRTVDLGPLRIDLPPGVLGRAVGGENPSPPGLRPETLALFRGSFRDREEGRVVLGGEGHWGYVDLWRSARPEAEIRSWIEGPAAAEGAKDPPRGDPEARWLRGIDYTEAAGPPTGAEAVALARFGEGLFAGSWLAARLRFGEVIVEVGLPLSEGERSLAAFWIPTTLRAAGAPPPPPPVDLSERYEIRFVAADPRDRGLLQLKAGDLVAEELRMMVPAGWRVALSSRAERGYPVRLRPREGGAVITLERLAGGRDLDLEERSTALEERLGLSAGALGEWEELRKPSRYRASRVISARARRSVEGGEERRLELWLLRPQSGRADFALVAEAPAGEWTANLEKTVELTFGSLRCKKAGRKEREEGR